MIIVEIPQPDKEVTPFERTCIDLAEQGYTIDEIARKFCMSSYEIIRVVSNGRYKGYKSGYDIKK